MFITLLLKEIKYNLKNISLYIFAGFCVFFYFTQFVPPDPNVDIAPKPNQEYYGKTSEEDVNSKIKAVYQKIILVINTKEVFSYKSMFGRYVRLSDSQLQMVKKISNQIHSDRVIDYENFIPEVTFSDMEKMINRFDKEMGGGTVFSEKYRDMMYSRNKTYDEAIDDFNEIITKDKLTNAAGRLFADYMGITAGFFPVFLAAFIMSRDKRSKSWEVINSKNVSSAAYLWAKVGSVIILVSTVYLILSIHPTIVYYKLSNNFGYDIELFAFFKYTIIWVIPTVIFVCSLSVLISVVTGKGIISLVGQFVLWLITIGQLSGAYGLNAFVIRFNQFGGYDQYLEWKSQITLNRVFYIILSFVIIYVTTLVFEYKRAGGKIIGKSTT